MKRLLILVLLTPLAVYSVWSWVQQNRENTWQEEMKKALGAHASQRESEAQQILNNLLPKTEQWWPNSPHLADTLTWLGVIQRIELKYAEAKPVLKRAVQICEAQGSSASTALGRAKLNLAIIARDQLDDVAAQQLFSEAADILTKDSRHAWGDDAGALMNLGYLASKQGHYQDAESYFVRAIKGYEALSVNVPESDLANAHFGLGEAYRSLDRDADAAEQYQVALKMYEHLEGPQGKDVRNVVTGLSLVQEGKGGDDRASALMQRALEISKNMGDVDGATLNNLAGIAEDQGRYAEAESLYRKACSADEKSGGANDLGLATALANLGTLYRDHEQFDVRQAEIPLLRALAIRENMLGKEHPETADIVSDLSLLYFYEKDFARAEQFALRALPIEEKAFGAGSLRVSTTLNRLGISERDLGNFKDAEANLQRALAIRKAKRAPDSWIVISLVNLASVYSLQGENAKAEPLMARAQAIRFHSSSR
jgi:tetratricopeptide (TPR) repeat protein